tara:strand:- start:240 stop:494 length:255 start_codon:yes stop_codon:yes gene_type:complete
VNHKQIKAQVGDLVKFVGSAATYRDRMGIITKTYGCIDHRIDSALVHFIGLEGKGRDAPCDLNPTFDGLHPMSLDELEVINESR